MYTVQLHNIYPAAITFGFFLVFAVAPFGGLPALAFLLPFAFDPPLLLPPPLLLNEALVALLLPVAEDSMLPLDRSVPPPPPPVPRRLLLLSLMLPPAPSTVLVPVLVLVTLLPPPLSDDVIEAAELLAVVALEVDEREDERLPLSLPT